MDHEMTQEAAWDQLSEFARTIVEAMGRDINDFDTDDWPDNVTQAVAALAAALAAERAISDDLVMALVPLLAWYRSAKDVERADAALARHRAARQPQEG